MSADLLFTAPLVRVKAEWVDPNGHMNVAYYVAAFDQGIISFLDHIGCGYSQIEISGASDFTLEMHVTYMNEMREGNPLRITVRLLDYDHKRFHVFMEMYHATENYLAATCEKILMHMDMKETRPRRFSDETLSVLAKMHAAHKNLPVPKQVGHVIGIKRK